MNLQHLRYFKLACAYQNISKAAQKLNIAQSSLSLSIKSLESEFGICLIKRQRVGFVLTPEGERFLALTEGLLEHADRVVTLMTDESNQHKQIKLGIPPMTGTILLPTLFKDFSRRYPDIKIAYSEAGRSDLLQQLNDNMLDLAILPSDEGATFEGYNSMRISKDEDVCCVSENHPLADRQITGLSDLASYPMVMFSESFYHNDKMMYLFREAGLEPNIICYTTQLSTMEQLITDNIAVGFLFKERAKQLQNIKWFSLEPPIHCEIVLVWKKDMHISKDIRILLDYFKERRKG